MPTLTRQLAEGIRDAFSYGPPDKSAPTIAFVAVLPERHAPDYIDGCLGVAVANSPGYRPVPEAWAHYHSFELAQRDADRLNDEILKLSPEEAARIIISTMGGKQYFPNRKRED